MPVVFQEHKRQNVKSTKNREGKEEIRPERSQVATSRAYRSQKKLGSYSE
jgi:hypothetical protein